MNKLIRTFERSATRCLPQLIKIPVLLAALILASTPLLTRATPYASAVSNNAGIVWFTLNEAADNVTVTLDGGASALDLGPLPKGTTNFNLGGATTYSIAVRKSAALGWSLISSDSNSLVQFNAPRGVAVNTLVHSPQFGRIYVANSASGTTTSGRTLADGIYILNPDHTDALGRGNTASTAGITFDTVGGTGNPGANSPWRIEVGEDNRALHLGLFHQHGGHLLHGPGCDSGRPGVGGHRLEPTHVTEPGAHDHWRLPIVRGSLAAGTLTVWSTDGRYNFPAGGSMNRLMRWDVGAGPLPHSNAPALLANPMITSSADVTTDSELAPDGKFFILQNRSVGNESGLFVVDTNGTTVLWASLATSRAISNSPTAVDILRVSRAVKVSPDGKRVAVIRDDMQTWVIPLTNGIPNLAARELVNTAGVTSTLGRDVAWDMAGNLYTVSSGNQLLRVFSPGGATVATTRSDGTFHLAVAEFPVVSVVASDPITAESGFDPATLQLARSGDTSEALTVNYTLSGTASNGVDYETLSGAVVFDAGSANALVSISPIDDTVAELTETVIFTLLAGTNYAPGLTNTATVQIRDNEYPNVLRLTGLDTNSYERFTNDVFTFRLTRLGDLNVEISQVHLAFDGTADEGSDYFHHGHGGRPSRGGHGGCVIATAG